jgi:hypothetical protein
MVNAVGVGSVSVVVGSRGDAAVLLDIDGVLIPFGAPDAGWGDWTRHPSHVDLILSPGMMAGLRGLPADVHWLTSWGPTANEVLGPFIGWPPLRVLDEVSVTRRWWKLEAVEEFLAASSYGRVAWLDDDLDQYADEVQASLGPLIDAGGLLPVCPNPSAGLTREALAAVDEFLSLASMT